jgi:hypothetical protein
VCGKASAHGVANIRDQLPLQHGEIQNGTSTKWHFNKIAFQQNGCKTKNAKRVQDKAPTRVHEIGAKRAHWQWVQGKSPKFKRNDLNTRAAIGVQERCQKGALAQEKSPSLKGIHGICKKRASTKTIL